MLKLRRFLIHEDHTSEQIIVQLEKIDRLRITIENIEKGDIVREDRKIFGKVLEEDLVGIIKQYEKLNQKAREKCIHELIALLETFQSRLQNAIDKVYEKYELDFKETCATMSKRYRS